MMLFAINAIGQLPGDGLGNVKFLGDTALFHSLRTDGRGMEEVFRNSTFDSTGGIFTNRDRGLGYWKHSRRLNDSLIEIGGDIINIGGSSVIGCIGISNIESINDSTIRVTNNCDSSWDVPVKGTGLIMDCPPQELISGSLDIYHENVEWITNANSVNIDPASTNFPCNGSLSVEGTTVGDTDLIDFEAPSPPNLSSYNFLVFKISSKAQFLSGQSLLLSWLNTGAGAVGGVVNFTDGSYGFNSSLIDTCQLIYIPLSAFGDIAGADELRISGSAITSGTLGFYIDDIILIQSPILLNSALTWDETMRNSPDITQDYFSHFNSSVWTIDSIKRLNIHVEDWVDINADKDAGREYIIKGHVTDNPYSVMGLANSTVANKEFHPLIFGYTSAFPTIRYSSALAFRGIVAPENDYFRSDTALGVFNFVADISNNKCDPNAGPFTMVHNIPIFFVGDSDLAYFQIYANGQHHFNQYGQGTFAGTETYLAGFSSDGTVVEVDPSTVGGGSSTVYVDSLWRIPGIDSIYWSKNGITNSMLDSIGSNLQVVTSNSLDIYHENIEWTTSESAGSTIDPASTTLPCTGSVSINGTTVAAGDYIQFDAPSVPNYTLYNYLIFKISSKATWSFGQRLRFRFLTGTTPDGVGVSFGDNTYGFNSSITDSCQLIYIPLSAFGNITGADNLRITGNIAVGVGGTIGYFIDDIILQFSAISPIIDGAMTWDQTMNNSPDISKDYFSHFNSSIWTMDSITQLRIHVLDWVDIIGDKDAGREYIMKGHVNDNPNSIFFIGNSTHINGAMHPMTGGYLDQNALNVEQGAYSVRGITHTTNDVLSTGNPVIQFVVVTSDNETDPNAAPLGAVHNQNVFGVGDSDLQFLMIKASGQLQLPMYVGGAFAGSAVYGLGLDIDGNVVITDTSGGGGSADRFGLEDVTTPTDRVVAMSGHTLTLQSSAVIVNSIFSEDFRYLLHTGTSGGELFLSNTSDFSTEIEPSATATGGVITLPDGTTGNHVLAFSVNGTFADASGNIDLTGVGGIGTTPNLQQVTDVDNTTTNIVEGISGFLTGTGSNGIKFNISRSNLFYSDGYAGAIGFNASTGDLSLSASFTNGLGEIDAPSYSDIGLTIKAANQGLNFGGYGIGAKTGTAVYGLGVDALGNVVETGATGGGGTTPDLQAVTDVGFTTTNQIISTSAIGFSIKTAGNQLLSELYENGDGTEGVMGLYSTDARSTQFQMDSIILAHDNGDAGNILILKYPESATRGNYYLPISVNGAFADAAGDITVTGGSADGNFANNDLTADADRTHDFSGHFLEINNTSHVNISSSNISGDNAGLSLTSTKAAAALSASDFTTNASIGVNVTDPFGPIPAQVNMFVDNGTTSSLFVITGGHFNFTSLQNFASNAAAITGGLVSGDIYRNGDVVQIVH